MGRIEKAIVLTVLLGVILILAVSMDLEGDSTAVPDVPTANPADALAEALDEARGGVGPRTPDLGDERGQGVDPALTLRLPADRAGAGVDSRGTGATEADEVLRDAEFEGPGLEESGLGTSTTEGPARDPLDTEEPDALLSTTVRDGANRASERDAGARIPEGSALVTLRGLERTVDANLMRYDWTVGDSFAALAERFYGDVAYEVLLRRSNEGRDYYAEGDEILVPVFDRLGLGPADADDEPTVAADGEYVVREGDSLWTISKKTLGKGSRWREIHQLNIDRLPRADAVRPGMVLRIPKN